MKQTATRRICYLCAVLAAQNLTDVIIFRSADTKHVVCSTNTVSERQISVGFGTSALSRIDDDKRSTESAALTRCIRSYCAVDKSTQK